MSLPSCLSSSGPNVHDGGACRGGLCKKSLSYEHAYQISGMDIPERAAELITMLLATLEEQEHVYL